MNLVIHEDNGFGKMLLRNLLIFPVFYKSSELSP